jgi:hypothetical protein
MGTTSSLDKDSDGSEIMMLLESKEDKTVKDTVAAPRALQTHPKSSITSPILASHHDDVDTVSDFFPSSGSLQGYQLVNHLF